MIHAMRGQLAQHDCISNKHSSRASLINSLGVLCLQDVFNCMCLSEGVYKVVDFGVDKAAEILAAIIEGFPPGLVTLKRVEWSQPDAQHR